MAIKVFNEEQLEQMTDKEYDSYGSIYVETIEEDKETKYANEIEVMYGLMNDYHIDIQSTDAYKKLMKSVEESDVTIGMDTFYGVLFDQLFECDYLTIDYNKDIVIEEAIEDASFDYDYGSISATHKCFVSHGYNIIVRNIDL